MTIPIATIVTLLLQFMLERYLPSWGTFALFCLLVFFTWWRERGWKTVAESRKERIGEMLEAAKETETRLNVQAEKISAQGKEIAGLRERTDLGPLSAALSQLSTLIEDWKTEGRGRFEKADTHLLQVDARIAAIHAEQTAAMQAVLIGMKDLNGAMQAQAGLLASHMEADQTALSDDLAIKQSMTTTLVNLEQRSRVNTELYSALLSKKRPGRAANISPTG